MRSKLALLAFLLIAPLTAQLAPPNPAGVRMGHIHLFVPDVDAQKAFWVAIMGGRLVKNNGFEMIQFPGAFILLTHSAEPREPPAGAIVNHFGFVVKDMPAMLARWKANNLRVEPTENPNEAYVYAPDGIRLEVYGVPDLPVPVQMNHIHFYVSAIPEIQAWYAKVFAARAGQRRCVACISKPRMIETDDLPGVNLSFSASDTKLAPTKGRSLDHIGFDVTDLDAFMKRLNSLGVHTDSPARHIPHTKVTSAFLSDPWGTSIELTQGLRSAAHSQ